jgi:hypothetical protein
MMMGFHLLGPSKRRLKLPLQQVHMLSVVSLLYVLGILAKPNFKVYEPKYISNNPSRLRAQSLRFKFLEGQP